MKPGRSVKTLALELDVWETFVQGVAEHLESGPAHALIERLGDLPVRASRAAGLLGCYAHRAGEPLCIRVQLRQERAILRITLLHELAHACEHLLAADPRGHRCGHGPAWREWALRFGIPPDRQGRSPALDELRRERLKPVAVCQRCGYVFHRLRRLSRRRGWLHPECGNGRVVPLAPDRERADARDAAAVPGKRLPNWSRLLQFLT